MRRTENLSKTIITLISVLILTEARLNAQSELDVLRNSWLQFTDAPNFLYHHLSTQACSLLALRTAEITRINSLADWQQRQARIQETLQEIMGPFPEKSPLNAQIVKVIQKEGYRAEHIVFESQPGFYVTGSMFIPANLQKKSKAPAVIYCSGHSAEGYRSPVYQHVILNLVRKGFIVFAFDPVGQGERLEYYDPEKKKSSVGGPTSEHSYPGTQAFITGSSQARYMIWDGIRAVDYLFTRPEVDVKRIGITGRSGGGTQSAYIAAMDDRILAAAPECYITNFTRLFQSIGPQDAEQNFFHGIIRGIDHADLLLVRAPKPALMITTTRDMFSIQGAMETESEVSRIYKAYGREDNFGRAEDDAPHESTQKNRESMVAFFQKHLNNPGNPEDEEIETLSAEEMRVTETGQVSTSLGGETVFTLNRKETEKQIDRLKALKTDIPEYLSRILKSAKELSGYQEPEVVDDPVFTGRIQREGYVIEKYFMKGEGDYVIPFLKMIPDKPGHRALIYLHPSGKSAEASKDREIEWFVNKGFTVISPDLAGIGETGPGIYKGDAYLEGISHNVWYASVLTGRSITGIRAGDVVRLSMWMKQDTSIHEVCGLARKELAPVLLHAAAFDQTISRIALIEPYSSYKSIVMNRFYQSAFILSAVPGALTAYDLPDLAACLAPRKLLVLGITDGNGVKLDYETILKEYNTAIESYDFVHSGGQLKITSGGDVDKQFEYYLEWIK